eukprot:400115-Prymnesium_polylepis.1
MSTSYMSSGGPPAGGRSGGRCDASAGALLPPCVLDHAATSARPARKGWARIGSARGGRHAR